MLRQQIKSSIYSKYCTKQSNSVTTYQGRVGGMGSSATKAQTAKSTSGFTGFRKAVSTYKATSSLPKYKPQVNSSINDYIRKNNIQAPKIEEDYTSYFPKYGYRNGVGKPEGIVVHDTANDNSTIDGEIAFMKRNYNSAFVHAFVDGNRIVETAPTDYLSGEQAQMLTIDLLMSKLCIRMTMLHLRVR